MESRINSSFRIFLAQPTYDRYMLLLPFAFVPFTVLELNRSIWLSSNGEQIMSYVINGVFLGVIHILFAFPLLLALPELIGWTRDRIGGRAHSYWLRLAAMLIVFGASLWTLENLRGPQYKMVTQAIVLFLIFYRSNHSATQLYGVSMLYNFNKLKEAALDEDERRRILKGQVWERNCSRVLRVCLAIDAMAPLFFPRSSFVWRWSIVLALLACLLWFLAAFRFPGEGKLIKILFLARVFFYGLMPFSRFAIFAVSAAHGSEYFGVMQKMISNSDASKNRIKAARNGIIGMFFLGAVLAIWMPFSSVRYFTYLDLGSQGAFTRYMVIAVTSVSFLHYYMDRDLFRMRRDTTRFWVSRLLVP